MWRRDRATNRLVWILPTLWLAGIVGQVGLTLAGCDVIYRDLAFNDMVSAGLIAVGLLIIVHRPANRIGWLCGLSGAYMWMMFGFSDPYANCAVLGPVALPGGAYMAWVSFVGAPLMVLLLFSLLPLWFPDGRFLTLRWRRFALAFMTATCAAVALAGLLPGPLEHNGVGTAFPIDNPFGQALLPAGLKDVMTEAIGLPLIGSAFVGAASLVVRWRRSTGDTRQQLKWFAYFLGTAVSLQLIVEAWAVVFRPDVPATWFEYFYLALNWIVWLGFPAVIGLTVFRYRLYDIDLIIRRTLVYGGLTATLAVVYFVSVVVLQRLLPAESPLAIVISTLAIAALFNPLRRRIQNDIDRLFYRRKYNAQQTLAAFAATARDETDVDALTDELVRVVEETMQPAHVSLWLKPRWNVDSPQA